MLHFILTSFYILDQDQVPRPPQTSDQKWASPRRKGITISLSKVSNEKDERPFSPSVTTTPASFSNSAHSNKYNEYFSPVYKSRRVQNSAISPQRPSTAPSSRSKRPSSSFSPRSNRTSTQIYINPFNSILLQRYRVSNKYVTTNNETYGLFVKKINQVLNVQKKFIGSSGFVNLR